MRAGQRMIANDGYEVMLFPMEYMNISQGEYGSTSHYLAMDFLGWGANGRVYQCPYYAPCSCRCVAHWGSDANTTWESLDKVHLPDGRLTKVTWCCQHADNPLPVGTILSQGDYMGSSGTYAGPGGYVTGDHFHFNTAIGSYDGYEHVPGSTTWYELKNSSHIYNTCYVNDTIIVDGNGYNWIDYTGPTPPIPTPSKNKKFPWFIYAQRFRKLKR